MPGRRASSRPHSVTPDGRYFVVDGRLWRTTNPNLLEARRRELVSRLMRARRDVGTPKRANDQAALQRALQRARQRVHRAKVALGERGPVWWTDGSPDYNRYLVENSPYAKWFANLRG